MPQADSLIVDLYMGTTNPAAGFRWTIGGFWNSVVQDGGAIHSVNFNFEALDALARGLHGAGVRPGQGQRGGLKHAWFQSEALTRGLHGAQVREGGGA